MTSSLAQSNEKLQAEINERRRTSEERDQVVALLDTMAVLVMVLDQEGRLIRVNRACLQAIGYSQEEIQDRPIWETIIAPEDVTRTKVMFLEMLATRIPPVFEVWFVTQGGQRRLFSWYYALLPTEVDTVTYIIGAGLDITDRKRAEEALEASEFRYRTLVENVDLGVTLLSPDYKIIMANAGLGKIFNKPPEEFVGKYCFQEFEKRDGICPHCPAVKAMASGQPTEVDTIGVHDDGTFHYAHVRAFPTFDSQRQVTGFVVVVEDTTAQRQVEEQLSWESKVNSSVAELSRAILASRSIEDISQIVLESAMALTNSSLGYCGYIDPQTGYFIVPTLSREVWETCKVPDKDIIFKEFTGLWGYGLEHRQPVLSNDLATDPRSSGTPQGHIPIHNFISVPAMLGEHLLGQLAIANASRDYSAKDQEVCQRLALIYALAIQRHRAEAAVSQSEARFRDITEKVAEWVWEADLEGRFTYSSPVVEQLLGYRPEEVLGQHFYDFFLPDERQNLKDQAFALLNAKQPFRDFINSNLHKNGDIVWLSTSGVPVFDATGNLLGYRGIDIDITERRKSQEALEKANIQLKALVQEAHERNNTMELLNKMGEMLQTCQTSEEVFSTISHFVPKFFPTDAGALYLLRNSKNLLSSVTTWGSSPPSEELFLPEDCWAVRSGHVHRVDDPASAILCKHVTASGPLTAGYLCVPLVANNVSLGILHIRFRSCAIQGREAQEIEGKQRLAVTIGEDLSLSLANLKLRETLQNQAIRDPLTGLYNRRYLEETMDRELHRSERLKAPLGVVMMDLDHFKNFNDNFGHGAGDALLCALAHVITAGTRTEDIACRYGGEEFLLVMPGASLETTRERSENLCQTVKALQVRYQGRFLKSTTISLGIAIFPDQGHTAEELITAADAALYRAKQAGRDRVEMGFSNPPGDSAP
jgi:diguanylate cyclase (GGDEF)-like protein/PAS domain S-box-containing protein